MSMSGLFTFSQNIKSVMRSGVWRNAEFEKKGEIAYRLLNSRFGLGVVGRVDSLVGIEDVSEESDARAGVKRDS